MATSNDIVTRTLQLLVTLQGLNKTFRNGYTTDSDQSLVPVLPLVNDFLSILSLTAIKPTYRNLTWPANSSEILLPSDVVGVNAAYLPSGIPLRRSTRQAQDEDDPGWDRAGTPTAFFREGQVLSLNRFFTADTTIRLRIATALDFFDDSDPAQTLDEYIPDNVAQRLPYGPAYLFGIMDAENPLNAKRIGAWQQMAQGVIDECAGYTDSTDDASPVSLDEWRRIPKSSPSVRPKLPAGNTTPDTIG